MTSKRILGVFAHPDDETSSCAGTFSRYAAEGEEIWVATATRGEQGTLGTGGWAIPRGELPKVREQEQRAVAQLLGIRETVYLGYHDGEVEDTPYAELVAKVLEAIQRVEPDLVITYGLQGISHHKDHMAISRAATQAFHRYLEGRGNTGAASLCYVALPKEVVDQYEFGLDGVETEPTTVIDIKPQKARKVQALRLYRSQEDAQQLADLLEEIPWADYEYFHQVHPPSTSGSPRVGFW